MKILLSMNYKFFDIEPKELIKLIKKYDKQNLIQGFEIATNSKEDEQYLLELSEIALQKGYIINLHSPNFEDLDDAKKYFDFAERLSKIMKRKINIVYHSINVKNIDESKEKTKKQVQEFIKYINEKNYYENMELSIENLNDINNINRLKKEDLIGILQKQQNLKFTYDIGHEIINGIETEKLVSILENRLNNIHIHVYKNNSDHYPIYDINKYAIIRNLVEKYGTNKTIVLEYALDYIEGEKFEEKIRNYIGTAKTIDNIRKNLDF